MLPLASFELFASLDDNVRDELAALAEQRLVRAGQVVMRRGAPGRELLAVASGGLHVQVAAGEPPRLLGPGEILGEMSIVTGRPVSATVTTARDSHLWVIPREAFLSLLESHSSLRAVVTELAVQRLRQRESAGAKPQGQVALIGMPPPEILDGALAERWLISLHDRVSRLLPEVELACFDDGSSATTKLTAWRNASSDGALLMVALPNTLLDGLVPHCAANDAVVRHEGALRSEATLSIAQWGLADHASLRVLSEGRPGPNMRWAFKIDPAETGPAAERPAADDPGGAAQRTTPHLDRLARWLARQQVGIALSAGAALGFAHMGVLAELERLGLPIDCICGTSMGGVSGLMYGLAGEGEGAIEKAAWTLGRPISRRLNWLLRPSILSDRKLRERAKTIGDGRCLSDLSIPVSVVSTDLVRGERVVIDRGPVAEAFFCTGAVPGVLPPVDNGDRVLVDGALVSRLPVDLLPRSRCALRIAVNVIPSPAEHDDPSVGAEQLRKKLRRRFGFLTALSRSWDLIGWWHGAREAADADILIEPVTRGQSGLDFSSAWPGLVEAGRQAVRAQADEILAAAGPLADPPAARSHDHS